MKMRTKLHLIIYIVFTALLISCENEIPYNSGYQEPQLIMNALLDAESTENYVYLHQGQGNNIGRLNEATLTLIVNGKITETPQAMTPEEIIGKLEDYPAGMTPVYESILFKKFRLTTALHPGDHIRLEATAENGKFHVSSEVTVPQPLEAIHVDTCLAYLREYNTPRPYRQYKITLQDRPNEKNYYRLEITNNFKFRCEYKIFAKDENGDLIPTEDGWDWVHTVKDTLIDYSLATLINREDIILTDGHLTSSEDEENEMFPSIENKYNVFSDSRFSNSSATLKVYTQLSCDYYPAEHDYTKVYCKHTIDIRLISISEKEYRYLKALNCLDDGDYDNVLMEPVSLPSNVEGGLGFVGACSGTKYTIEFPEVPRRRWE